MWGGEVGGWYKRAKSSSIITGSKQVISKTGVKQKHITFKYGGKCQRKIIERVTRGCLKGE